MNLSFGTYDYPAIGTVEADGTNFLEKILSEGKRARQIVIYVNNYKNATVLFNGQVRSPDRFINGQAEYFYRHVGTSLTSNGKKEYGGIESAIVKGQGVTFRAKIST